MNWQCYVSVVRLCWASSLRNSLELGIIILKYGNRVKVCTRQYMLNAIKYSEDSYDISIYFISCKFYGFFPYTIYDNMIVL